MRATQVQEQEYARWLRERDIAQRRRELDGTMLQLGVPPLMAVDNRHSFV